MKKTSKIPLRIISLVPSISELLWDLGLQQELIGITKFCIHPDEMFRKVERIGGTKTLDLEKIKSLQPDLIIGNKEENVKEQIEELKKDFNLILTDVNTVEEGLEMIHSIGLATDREAISLQIVKDIKREFSSLKSIQPKSRVIYFIWKSPYMVAGQDTFIHSMLEAAGFENCICDLRYPEIALEDCKKLNPDHVLLSTEPFPFKEDNLNEFKDAGFSSVHLVDGELFSWYGSRMRKSAAYFTKLNHQLQQDRNL